MIVCLDCATETGCDLAFFVPGNPKGRVHTRSFIVQKKGGHPRAISAPQASPEQRSWTAAVRDAALQAMGGMEKIESGAVALSVEFIMPRRSADHWKGPHAEPRCCGGLDSDNLIKALCDALNGVVFADDRQISDIAAQRRYARHGEVCGARISIKSLGEWY